MAESHRSAGFTLVEVLIVVALVAVLAAVVIPQFASPVKDAMQSALEHDLQALRTQIELYRIHHRDRYPTIQDSDLPQLTTATNVLGELGTPGAEYPFGPYLGDAVPPNPFDGSNKVTPVAVPRQMPLGVVGTLGGWQYDKATGAIWPNHPEYYEGHALDGAEEATPPGDP